MIREHAVRLEVAAAACVRAQDREHLVRVKAAGAVACVHHDMEALQRMVIVRRVDLLLDLVAQALGIGAHVVGLCDAAAVGRRRVVVVLRKGQNRLNIAALQAAAARKEFETVAVKGMVAGGDLQRAVAA